MKVIHAVHEWFPRHHRRPARHIADENGLPLCKLQLDTIKIEKWKTVRESPTCHLCKNTIKRLMREAAIAKKSEIVFKSLKSYLNSNDSPEQKLRNIADNIPIVLKQVYSKKK